jgi:hypothetical protein
MALKGRWTAGRLQLYDGVYSAIGAHGIDFGTINSGAILHGGGTESYPLVYSTADKKFISYYLTSSATSGTSRGLYVRLNLTANAGGEAARLFTVNSSNTPADTVNGAHISLQFGASTGNVTGQSSAARMTLMVPDRTLNGTNAAAQLDLFADGTSSTGTNLSFIRATLVGNGTGAAAIEDAAYFLNLDGGSNASGNIVGAQGNEPTWASHTFLIRCLINGAVLYLVAISL